MCERWLSNARAKPYYLRLDGPTLPERVVGTDLEFGQRDEQQPLLLVGPGLGEVLAGLRATGLTLDPVEPDWRRRR